MANTQTGRQRDRQTGKQIFKYWHFRFLANSYKVSISIARLPFVCGQLTNCKIQQQQQSRHKPEQQQATNIAPNTSISHAERLLLP